MQCWGKTSIHFTKDLLCRCLGAQVRKQCVPVEFKANATTMKVTPLSIAAILFLATNSFSHSFSQCQCPVSMVAKMSSAQSVVHKQGFCCIIGSNEAGRGSTVAGLVVVTSCCSIKTNFHGQFQPIEGADNSKALTEEERN